MRTLKISRAEQTTQRVPVAVAEDSAASFCSLTAIVPHWKVFGEWPLKQRMLFQWFLLFFSEVNDG